MKYRLYDNATNDIYERDKLCSFLKNRGIEKPNEYLNLSISNTYSYELLDNINDAVELFKKHYDSGNKIAIIPDNDPDGFCSAAMMYNYIKQMDNGYPVEYIMHQKAKSHGLCGDVKINDDVKLLILPDAGTNDYKECKKLANKGIDIIVLDHHEQEEKHNDYAVVVNNQISNRYPNKELCGAGIVYKFLQALDDEYWQEYSDDYLDLVALANISDVMDIRSYETKYYINVGLKNIKNKCFNAIIKSQEFSIGGRLNTHSVQFCITPVLNGCIRFASNEEKELLFRAFIEQDEYFEYKKKATKDHPAEIIQESIYDRAARLSKNAKSRQDKARDKAVEEIINMIGDVSDDQKVILVDITDVTESSLTGLIAIKISEKYGRPCILVNGDGGSARNFKHSPIESFKNVVNRTEIFSGQGHANAFGIIGLKKERQDDAIIRLNELLKDVEYDLTYLCDYILDACDISVSIINDLDKTYNYIGTGIDDPMIAIENICINRNDISVFGKSEDTISFNINEIKFIMFKCHEGNPLYDFVQDAWEDNDSIEIAVVGKPNINEYEGVKTPQITIENVNVVRKIENNNSEEDFEW